MRRTTARAMLGMAYEYLRVSYARVALYMSARYWGRQQRAWASCCLPVDFQKVGIALSRCAHTAAPPNEASHTERDRVGRHPSHGVVCMYLRRVCEGLVHASSKRGHGRPFCDRGVPTGTVTDKHPELGEQSNRQPTDAPRDRRRLARGGLHGDAVLSAGARKDAITGPGPARLEASL